MPLEPFDRSSSGIDDDDAATCAKTEGVREIEEMAMGRRKGGQMTSTHETDTDSKQAALCQMEQQAASRREPAKGERVHNDTLAHSNDHSEVQDDTATAEVTSLPPGAYRVVNLDENPTSVPDEDPEQPPPRNEPISNEQNTLTAVVVNEEEERERIERVTLEEMAISAVKAEVVNDNRRKCIIGMSALLVLVVTTLVVIFIERSSANDEKESQTVNSIESLEWVEFANKVTLSPSVLSYPATDDSSIEERALAWLVEEGGAVPEEIATQHFAFVVLSFAMNVSDWNLERGFDECGLKGVVCDSQRKAIEINLRSEGVEGKIPHDIALLSGIRTLDFWDNHLAGPVPWDHMIMHMKDLNYLNIDVNKLTGPLPNPTAGSWQKLGVFWARRNEFVGTLSTGFAYLPMLHELHVEHNQLTGTIPTELGRTTSMQFFSVMYNAFSGSLPTEIGHWTKMKTFEVGGNDLTGTIPTEIGYWTDLESFLCYSNEVHGTVPTEIANFSNLELFHVYLNDLSGPIPSYLGGLTSIEEFYVNGNKLTGPLPQGMENWTDLKAIKVDMNQFTGTLPNNLGTWTDLKVAHFQANSLNGTTQSFCDVNSDRTVVFADCCEVTCPCCTSCFADDGKTCEILS